MIDDMRRRYKQLIEKFAFPKSSDLLNLSLNGRKFEIRLATVGDWPNISINFFLPNKKYARKGLTLSPDGILTEDHGIIPEFDRDEDEPIFTQSNEELLELAAQHLLAS